MNFSVKMKAEAHRAYEAELEKKMLEFHQAKQVELDFEELGEVIVSNLRYIGTHFCSFFFCKKYAIVSDVRKLSWEFRGQIFMTNVYPVIVIKIIDGVYRFSVDYINDSHDEFIMYKVYKYSLDMSEASLETMLMDICISLAQAKAAGKFFLQLKDK